jgi:hypothetical protein
MCVGCPGEIRIRDHRAAVSVPQERKPLAWPADVVTDLAHGMKAFRLGILRARAWLRLQPDDAHRAANLAQLQQWERQLVNAEQTVMRTGVARDAVL